jgi:hypothetical protein
MSCRHDDAIGGVTVEAGGQRIERDDYVAVEGKHADHALVSCACEPIGEREG